MPTTRPPAVAGKFYPADGAQLRAEVTRFLAGKEPGGSRPKAIIVPHAGYRYSGPIAASAYARVATLSGVIARVLMIGPAHYVKLSGLAAPSVDTFTTTLGEVAVDIECIDRLLRYPQVSLNDDAHQPEHCLEVQLPFLQVVLEDFQIVPLLVGRSTADDVAEIIEQFWDAPDALIVISSDLSHFHDYETAGHLDAATSAAIGRLEASAITGERACGHQAICGLLETAKRHGAAAEILDVRNSGDTSGSPDRVVGYGAYAIA